MKAAKLIGRTPVAVKMKVGNFGSFDPELKKKGIVGLSNTSRLDEEVWNEYCNDWEKLAYDSELILAKLTQKPIEENIKLDLISIPEGKERERFVKQRINQSFFRNAVLSSYSNKCCISNLTCTDLLEACHIVDWSDNIKNRLNPSNGLCLNVLFHKAYDKNLLGISPDYVVYISDKMFDDKVEQENLRLFFGKYHKTKIQLPDKFLPNRDLLDIHFRKFQNQ